MHSNVYIYIYTLSQEWGSFTRALTTMFEITLANFGPKRYNDND